jgi:hypothetical protein
MSLSQQEIDSLLRMIRLTCDHEIDCECCLSRVAEFAERELTGQSIPAALEAVEHHLAHCSECCEEYQALLQALRAMAE